MQITQNHRMGVSRTVHLHLEKKPGLFRAGHLDVGNVYTYPEMSPSDRHRQKLGLWGP